MLIELHYFCGITLSMQYYIALKELCYIKEITLHYCNYGIG